MTKEDIKAMLESVGALYASIDSCNDVIREFMDLCEFGEDITPSDKVKSYKNAYIEFYKKDLLEQENKLIHITQLVRKLDDPIELEIIYKRYFNNINLVNIAEIICYSYIHTNRLYNRALTNLIPILENEMV